MSYKTIVVHVGQTEAAIARVDYAAELALAHQAHLIGFHPVSPFQVPIYSEVAVSAELINVLLQQAEDGAAAAQKIFAERTGRVGVQGEWRRLDGDPVEMTALNARYADVVVVGQDNSDETSASAPAGFAEKLVFAVGRPVIVIPYIGARAAPPRRILVAWNAGREATLAVSHALPLLKRAEAVTVLAINPRGGTDGHGENPGADICLHLARHGVKAEASHVHAEDVDAGDLLLSRVADDAADLIVMGAYGHSRLREMVLGGVTRTVMGAMTVPVLMSH